MAMATQSEWRTLRTDFESLEARDHSATLSEGQWTFSPAGCEDDARFLNFATRGGRHLGAASGLELDAWLDRIRERLPSDYFRAVTTSSVQGVDRTVSIADIDAPDGLETLDHGGWLEQLRRASIVLCECLETDAMVSDQHGPTVTARDEGTGAQKPDTSRLITVKKAAAFLHVHEDTLRKMGRMGTAEIVALGPRTQRVSVSELLRLRSTPKLTAR
jgi:hypothetical protein